MDYNQIRPTSDHIHNHIIPHAPILHHIGITQQQTYQEEPSH